MADIKFTSLEIYNDDLSIEDKFPIVDISDNSMGATGTNKIIGADRVSRSVALLMPDNILNGGKLVDNSLNSSKLSAGSPTWSANSNINVGYETSNVDLTLNIGQNRTPEGKTSIRIFSNDGLNPTASIVKNSGNNSALTFTNDGSGGMTFNQTGAGNIDLRTNGNERMRITSDGNVGIGTSSPTAPLQVVGTITAGNLNVGGTVTAANVVVNGSSITLEGSIADANETTLTVTNPTAIRTITFPDASGTVVLSGAITNSDINSSAAIADTKLATISTSGKVSNSATTATSTNTDNTIVLRGTGGNFSAGTITANLSGNATTATTLATPRTIAISGAVTGTATSFNGGSDITIATTLNTVALSSLATGALPTGITIASANITDDTIVNADINASAAIAGTKISPSFGNQTVTANSFRARGGSPGANGASNNGYSFSSPGDNDSGMFSSADNSVEFYANNSEVMRITSGNVGIGTTSPSYKLDVNGDIKSRSGWILGARGTSGFTGLSTAENTLSGGCIIVRDDSATYNTHGIEFYTNSTERMRIQSNGNVGIGTTTPITKLDVNGGFKVTATANNNFSATISNSGTTNAYGLIVESNDSAYALAVRDKSNVYRFRAGADGTVSMGGTGNSFNITSGGNVGIGKTNPSTVLDVSGTVTATVFSGPLTGNATTATYATSAGTAETAGSCTGNAATATYATSAGTAETAGSCTGNAATATYATSAGSVANMTVSASKLDGGQTGSAPIYGIRAWAKFDGTLISSDATISANRSSGSSIVTLTWNGHPFVTGDHAYIAFASTIADTIYYITYVSSTQFQISTGATTQVNTTATITRLHSYFAGNVRSIIKYATGRYIVNFYIALPNSNYAITGSGHEIPAGAVSDTHYYDDRANLTVNARPLSAQSAFVNVVSFGSNAQDVECTMISVVG